MDTSHTKALKLIVIFNYLEQAVVYYPESFWNSMGIKKNLAELSEELNLKELNSTIGYINKTREILIKEINENIS